MIASARRKWLALALLCAVQFMVILDIAIVNVALPSIQVDLGFSQESLAWVVNAYLLTFGGFLLLGGRLGDLLGHRRMFLSGIALFTAASLACGLATTQGQLVAARAVQGIGGAVVSAVALSLIMTLFVEPAERAKAMGVFGFVLHYLLDEDVVARRAQRLQSAVVFAWMLIGFGALALAIGHFTVEARTRFDRLFATPGNGR